MRITVFLLVVGLFLVGCQPMDNTYVIKGKSTCSSVHDYVDSTAGYGSEYVYFNDSVSGGTMEDLRC